MFDRFWVDKADEEKWGRLVRGWARGVSEFPGIPYEKVQVPRSLDDLMAQCQLVRINVHVPASMTGLVVLQPGSETMVLRLPAKKLVEDAMAQFGAAGFDYQLPFFYDTYCGTLKLNGKDDEDKFQALRIGDYSIGQCM